RISGSSSRGKGRSAVNAKSVVFVTTNAKQLQSRSTKKLQINALQSSQRTRAPSIETARATTGKREPLQKLQSDSRSLS
ncbi:hypothetical protein FOPG_18412, partial [Fusarium oxysporum f. sp. conglutinans race 2 54008]